MAASDWIRLAALDWIRLAAPGWIRLGAPEVDPLARPLTPPPSEFLNRLEAALAALAPRLSREFVTAWRDCASRYGLEHPAALGCLIALAREAWADVEEPPDPELGSKLRQVIGSLVTVFMTPQGWTVGIPATAPGRAWCRLGRGRTVLEALVVALEGAAVRAPG